MITPHGAHIDGHFAVVRSAQLAGDASQWTDADTRYEGPGDPELADACVLALQQAGLPALGVTFGATAAGSSTMPLDWGALIPLWFMRAPAVVVSPCRALSNDEHVRAGAALAAATGHRRVALIASADHGHGHTVDGPYGFAAESAEYDEEIQAIVRDNRLGALRGWDPGFAVAAKADSFWQLLMLARGARRRLRRRAALLRGADVLRDAHRRVHPPAGLTQPQREVRPHGAQQAAPQGLPEDAQPREEADGAQAPLAGLGLAHAHQHPELIGLCARRARRLPRRRPLVRLQRRPGRPPRAERRSAPPRTSHRSSSCRSAR